MLDDLRTLLCMILNLEIVASQLSINIVNQKVDSR